MISSIHLTQNLGFYADDANVTGQKLLQNGFNYEGHIRKELETHLPKATGFLDIGANVGLHTVSAKQINPALWVGAFEMSPPNVELLCRNIVENGLKEVAVYPFAVADSLRIVRHNRDTSNTCCSTDLSSPQGYEELAPAIPLDHLKLPAIQLIKLDIEGFELLALRGMVGLIKRDKPRVIFEYCPEVAHRSGASEFDLLQWFLDREYSLTTLDYQAGMRATFNDAIKCHQHVSATSKWICDILAEPI